MRRDHWWLRRELIDEWPLLSHLFGLRPGDETSLTPRELARYRSEAAAWRARKG